MGSSRGAGAGLVRFLNDASANGVREALRTLNLESLAGRPIEEVFAGLADYSGLLQQQGVSSATSGTHSSGFPAQQSLTRNKVSARSVSRSAR